MKFAPTFLVSASFFAASMHAGCGGSTVSPADDAGTDTGIADGNTSATCPLDVEAAPGMLLTDRGAVRGSLEGGAYAYRNIPFAAAPVGSLRWRPPAPAACWSGPRDGAAWGPTCPQSDATGNEQVTGSEDCLQLNVFTPVNKAGETPPPRPIMFWIHGGGLVVGSAAQLTTGVRIYDGGSLASKEDVIVVSANYRLGALGFLAHPTLAAEDANRSEGNYGILDLVAALRWIQTNAAAMGGDPARVTIFGESAGAVNVCTLVTSPLAKGLFSGAIMQSGGCVAKERVDAETFGLKVFMAAKCDTAPDQLACMRALGVEAVVSALPITVDVAGATAGYGAVNDGYALAGKPLDVIKAGAHAKVPMIIGSNAHETSRTVPLAQTATEAQYQAAVRALLPLAADTVLAAYPAANYASPWAAYVALTTDAKFGCSARKAVRALAASSTPAFRYYFSHALDNAPALKAFGAWHGADVLYVFDKMQIAGYIPGTGDRAVVDAIMHRFASFARSPADPNGGQTPAWPPYVAASDPYLEFESPLETKAGLRTEQCDFWDKLIP